MLAVLIPLSLAVGCGGAAEDGPPPDNEDVVVRIVSPASLARLTVRAAVADDEDERTQGLRGIASLPANRGLLIVMPVEGEVCITNAGVRFPIDAVFTASDGTVVAVERNIPSGDVRLRCQPSTHRILEVNGGAATRVAPGDHMFF
jgi:uncharacterized membrane protein (UPF0127 family)